ncbi:PLAT/LH2 domain, partial [Sesbania bispinosa]
MGNAKTISHQNVVKLKASVTVKQGDSGLLTNLVSGIVGKTIVMELVSDDVDPKTNSEIKTIKGNAQKTQELEKEEEQYEATFELPEDFGNVGAVLIQNNHHQELFLKTIVLHGFPSGPVHLTCDSWIQPNHDSPIKRVFFTNKSYLPSQTPSGLRRLREEELVLLRGNGEGERKSTDRIYDYDFYNDLGDPDSNLHLQRPVLGGTKRLPYPRRCRTGRKHSEADPSSEKKSSNFYVPRDEVFSEIKQAQFNSTAISSGISAVLESIDTILTDQNLGFVSFEDIDTLYKEGFHLPPLKANGLSLLQRVIPRIIKAANDGQNLLRFDTPETTQ